MVLFATASVALICCGFAFYFWRRSQAMYQLLMDGANRFEELRQKSARLEHNVAQADRKIHDAKVVEETARKTLTATTVHSTKIKIELEQKQADSDRRLRNAELQRDHILAQFEQISLKYEDSIRTIEELKIQLATIAQERDKWKDQFKNHDPRHVDRLRNELTETRRKLSDQEQILSKLQARPSVDPRELETTRRRAANNELLFSSMKGLRDMVDERNRNWEDALLKLSTWILTQSSVARANEPVLRDGHIGPVVGEALKRIGVSLVNATHKEELEAEIAVTGETEASHAENLV